VVPLGDLPIRNSLPSIWIWAAVAMMLPFALPLIMAAAQ
jgi:hypothetical protein